jgi:hypothetical protein
MVEEKEQEVDLDIDSEEKQETQNEEGLEDLDIKEKGSYRTKFKDYLNGIKEYWNGMSNRTKIAIGSGIVIAGLLGLFGTGYHGINKKLDRNYKKAEEIYQIDKKLDEKIDRNYEKVNEINNKLDEFQNYLKKEEEEAKEVYEETVKLYEKFNR